MLTNRNQITTHPTYNASEKKRKKARTIYEGSSAIKAPLVREFYIYRHKNESHDDYVERAKRAILDPWAEKIINQRQAILWAKNPAREIPKDLESFWENIDLKGNDTNKFFFDVTKDAQIDGISFVLVNYTKPPEEVEIKSERDKRDYDIRPYFQKINAKSVIDWEFDDNEKSLAWALLHFSEQLEPRKPGESKKESDIYYLWTKNEWYKYELRKQSLMQIDSGKHGLGVVPLVPFYGNKIDEMRGESVLEKVLDHIVLLLNKESDKDHFEKLSCHPLPYAIGPKNPQKLDAGKGIYLEATKETGSASIGYLEPTGSGFKVVSESIIDIRFRILNIALAIAKKDTAQVQSSDAQKEEKRSFTASLANLSEHFSNAETKCWEIALLWDGDNKQKITVEYTKDFDDSVIEPEMIKVLSDLVFKDQLPLRYFLEILQKGELLSDNVDIENILNLLTDQTLSNTIGSVEHNN